MKKALLATIFFLLVILLLQNEQDVYEIKIYFCPENNCEKVYVDNILNNDHVFCAFYSLSNEAIINALNKVNSEIIVHEGNRRGLMHHKFCVLNNTHLILGSANPTDNDFFNNHNNVLLIKSSRQVERYTAEFNRLSGVNYNYPSNLDLKSYFCPYHSCQDVILNILNSAEESVFVLSFTFTDHDIARSLVRKNLKGLDVKVVTDNFQNKQYWVEPFLSKNSIDVKVNTGNIQHNKVFIIDDDIVITGSYNPTRAAHTINNENLLVIENEQVNIIYKEYFYTIWNRNI